MQFMVQVQVHGLGLEKFSVGNAQRIGNQIGRFVETEDEVESRHKTVMRLDVEVDVKDPLLAGF